MLALTVNRKVMIKARLCGLGAPNRFLALCLCREEPRQFYLERCQNVRLEPAANVLMPVAMSC